MIRDGNITLKPGVTLFEYRIDSVLGQGGFGITYKATDLQLNRTVAIKEYFPREFSHRDMNTARVVPHGNEEDRETFEWGLKRFLAEARTLARFHHPSIVAIRRFFEFNDTAYIVMDFAEGRSLSEILKEKGSLSWGEVKSFLPSLLDGLAIVHKAGVLHRDIKPANIYLRHDGTPILLDFGSASQEIVQHSRSVTSIASAGYGAVEQYSTHGKQAEYTDIYGLAATLYHVVTGKKPQDAPDRILEDSLEPSANICLGKFPAPFLTAIDKGLNVRPEARPKDVHSWSNQLLAVSANSQSTHNNSTQGTRSSIAAVSSNKKPNHKKYLVLVAIVFVIIIWRGFYINVNDEQSIDKMAAEDVSLDEGDISALAKNTNAVLDEAQIENIKEVSRDLKFSPVYSKNCPKDQAVNWDKCYVELLTFENGDSYQGDYAENKYNGIGVYRWKEIGEIYIGRWINNQAEGHGKYFYGNGTIYIGEFKNDEVNGIGTFFYADGNREEGLWLTDGKEIKRIDADNTSKPDVHFDAYTINKNAVLQEAKLDNINKVSKDINFTSVYSKQCPQKPDVIWDKCYGKMNDEDGNSYQGDWENNKFNGIGVYRWKYGEIYIGRWINNLKEGHGKTIYSNGDIYLGEFKNSIENGRGTFFDAEGGREEGLWLTVDKELKRIGE